MSDPFVIVVNIATTVLAIVGLFGIVHLAGFRNGIAKERRNTIRYMSMIIQEIRSIGEQSGDPRFGKLADSLQEVVPK